MNAKCAKNRHPRKGLVGRDLPRVKCSGDVINSAVESGLESGFAAISTSKCNLVTAFTSPEHFTHGISRPTSPLLGA